MDRETRIVLKLILLTVGMVAYTLLIFNGAYQLGDERGMAACAAWRR